MHELVVNLHMHTSYSDGGGNHAAIAKAALRTGLDGVIVTDHNVWVNGLEGYYRNGQRQVLMLIGEEVHDQTRDPQKNHLLVIGAGRELAYLGHDLNQLLKNIHESNGLAFLAHPNDPPAPAFEEPDISWVDWEIKGFNGIELWNSMSEFKGLLKSKLHAIFYAYNPKMIARGPFKETLKKWDELLLKGKTVVAIGGSDAHQFPARMGFLHRRLFPYEFHFKAINTHIWVKKPLSGELVDDRRLVFGALRKGHAFIGYDLPASTRGFRFTAHGKDGVAWMGDQISIRDGVTLQIFLPKRTECRLLKDGKVIKTWHRRETCTYITTSPGVYRVEAYIYFMGSQRGWIFSNPIYIKG